MPAYRVDLQRSAERDLERLARPLLERVCGRLSRLADDPRPLDARKLIGLEGYRLRVGDHRIVSEIDDRARLVIVVRVRHRRDVYRTLR